MTGGRFLEGDLELKAWRNFTGGGEKGERLFVGRADWLDGILAER